MPMTTTHALVPLAATLAFASRPVPWKLVAVAALAAAAPDVDGVFKHFLHVPVTSIYSHRGATHSLFVALAAGLVAAIFHRRIGVRPLTAGVVVAASMASHGILDMMTNTGLPVAYLWPLSSVRLFADWRPIQSAPVHLAHLFGGAFARLRLELWQLIIPMFAAALAIRVLRIALTRHRPRGRR
jgi:inner membrane protein